LASINHEDESFITLSTRIHIGAVLKGWIAVTEGGQGGGKGIEEGQKFCANLK